MLNESVAPVTRGVTLRIRGYFSRDPVVFSLSRHLLSAVFSALGSDVAKMRSPKLMAVKTGLYIHRATYASFGASSFVSAV